MSGAAPMGTMIGALVGTALGFLVLAAVGGETRTQLYAPSMVQPVSAQLATTMPAHGIRKPTAVRNSYETTAEVQASTAGAQQIPRAANVQSAQGKTVSLVAIASVIGAIGGFFFAKKQSTDYVAAEDIGVAPGRRQVLAAGVTAATAFAAQPAFAAYGDSANVFGKKAEPNQVYNVQGDGWSTEMPAKYNPSKQMEYENSVARWEDNFDSISNASVVVYPGVSGLGSQDDVFAKYVQPLLGFQSFEGETISEGGFASGKVASAALLDRSESTKDGKKYYYYELLTRTADGDEGGKHQLFSCAVSNNKLYILKHQAGDKRWFKGLEKPIKASIANFTVA